MLRKQWEYAASRIENAIGLEGQPRAIAFHQDLATGHEHMHVAWSRLCTDTMKARPLPFFKRCLQKASRSLEKELGLSPVPSTRPGPIRYSPTPAEERQAQRLGTNIHEIRETIRKCFDSAARGRVFQEALARQRFTLARGERRDFVAVDPAGGVHALGKRILGVSAAEIRTRLADLDRDALPTVEQSRRSPMPSEPTRTGTIYAATPPALRTQPLTLINIPTRQSGPPPKPEQSRGLIQPPVRSKGQQEGEEGPELCDSPPLSPHDIRPAEIQSETGIRPRLADKLRAQFRNLMKALTRRSAEPKPKTRRKREEAGKGFRAAAAALFRRLADIGSFDMPYPTWDAIVWLHTWACTDLEIGQDFADTSYERSSDFSPHP